MKTLLAVSPHLDDAVFSVGALLARQAAAGWRVVVATCFTATMPDPQGFALACQLDKGLGPEVDYMALRRQEDAAASRLLGVEARHLPLPEAPHRGYDSATALFAGLDPSDDVAGALTAHLGALLVELAPTRVLGPFGIGDHVDHRVVSDVLQALAPGHERWADLPYAARRPDLLPDGGKRIFCSEELPRKLAACAVYRSQTGFQFGDALGLERLTSIDGAELLFA